MEKANKKTPVRLSAQPWKLTLPGKFLAICVCVLPFLTRLFHVPLSESVQKAYFMPSATADDFEQIIREIGLLVIAVLAVGWFCYERLTLRPKRTFPMTKMTIAVMLCLVLYLILGLISTLVSPYRNDCWMGIHMVYEGYLALVSYAILFAAAWYWSDRTEVIAFVQKCLTFLAIVLGILAVMEMALGSCYYNNFFVRILSGLSGEFGIGTGATVTFGNEDYFGLFEAMLLPITVSMISRSDTTKKMLLQISAAVLTGTGLLLSKVMSDILFGFGTTAVLLLIWLWHSKSKKQIKLLVSGATAAAVLFGGFGFVFSRSGNTLSEKLQHTMVGMEQADTFGLLSIQLSGDTVTLENKDTVFTLSAGETLSPEKIVFTCNGNTVTPKHSESTISFSEPELTHCSIVLEENNLQLQLGYPTPIELTRTSDGWQAMGIGGDMLSEIPLVSHTKALQMCYPYLNGRVFVWANTISLLGNCLVIGHGPCTSLFYLNQNDLPALLNIFGRYVLYNKPHNWYLQMAQDTGVLSVIAVLLVLVLFFFHGFRRCFGKKQKWNVFHTGLLLAILTYCLCGILNDSLIYHAPMFWFLLGFSWRTFDVQHETISE